MDIAEHDVKFAWARFYETFASALLTWRDRRDELVKGIHLVAADVDGMSHLQDKPTKGESFPLKDICPFTTMGLFNRSLTDTNRKIIATRLANLLGVNEPVPDSFAGIPLLNNQKSWFFGYERSRDPDDIERLWEMFSQALTFADNQNTNSANFTSAYDIASAVMNVGWNLTMGLYWARPWFYPTLDSQSQYYIQKVLNIKILKNGAKGRCSGQSYLSIMQALNKAFTQPNYPVHSFPELSLSAWNTDLSQSKDEVESRTWKASLLNKIKALCLKKDSPYFTASELKENYLDVFKAERPESKTVTSSIYFYLQKLRNDDELKFLESGNYEYLKFEKNESQTITEETVEESAPPPKLTHAPYSISHLIQEGCFLEKTKIQLTLQRLLDKKNLILQGPPGTGKTWLARRLAYCLMGEQAPERINAVQFHPNLSYEDFIRGWRPGKEGRLTLIDGPFINAIKTAINNPAAKYVVIIEEINRGNPAQIFGETLTLMEADKRTPTEALALSYSENPDEKIYIPENLYIIGTMNIADRSLALLDLALRRRFAFIELKPAFNEAWKKWVNHKFAIDLDLLAIIESRLTELNEMLAKDTTLGPQFCIGHSYVTPATGQQINEAQAWYAQVVDTEICPLLAEYWFDAPNKVDEARKVLLAE
ncbi:AAA domain-containing protein [Salmonella enterica subsp. enterica serovar Enteritidis]|nr:AAA family ATPase [Salmonella enterica subsp. enterica serovar Newport]ECM0312664.1 AAA domain-containing protein [Salmonella enterica subsp. enterica serovar Enteritidis]EIT8734085.1 AAA family ATPase [Salmonella enterica]EDL3604865.1 AAA family ATPase [Salmonella enterica subsp. enterica serovar Newport]ELO2233283.1 AAA family ATPase [Salmonella enterica]